MPPSTQILLSSIILDESIYPRKGIDPGRVGIFAENIRDGFAFDPIEVEPCPDRPGFYRLLDGTHRWSAFKATGAETVFVIVRDLVLDPMAGGGVTPDTCLAMGRRCWAFEMKDRHDTRPEIEPFTWEISSDHELSWPVSAKEKPDLVIFDPPYFDKKAGDYDENSISGLSRNDYLDFLEAFFELLKHHVKKKTRLAFINAGWRDFQNTPAMNETHKGGIFIDDYLEILNKTGWYHTHIIQAPLSSQRFSPGVVSAMQKRNILGVTSRYVIILDQQGKA